MKRSGPDDRPPSLLDPVTGLPNRRRFDSAIRIETRRAMRGQYYLSVMKAGIDEFESYVDSYGSGAGDRLLQAVAGALKGQARRIADFIAYVGAGEFYIMLPMTGFEGALRVAQRMQGSVEALQVKHDGNRASNYATLSLGVTASQGQLGLSSSKLMSMADEALYRARRAAGNKVVGHQDRV